MSSEEFKNNVLVLAKTGKAFGIPVVLTTSRDWGPNGPLLPELKTLFPEVEVIRRPGVINAWRWPAYREAVETTGCKKLAGPMPWYFVGIFRAGTTCLT